MIMSSLSVQLPDSLYKSLQALAEQDGISVDQFIATAVAEKISALTTETYLEELAQRGNRTAYEAVLDKVPAVEPEPYDQLPRWKGYIFYDFR
jgi:predicted transcriptional regulator